MKYLLTILFLLSTGCNGFMQSSHSASTDGGNNLLSLDYQLSIQTGPFEGTVVVNHIRNSFIKIIIPVGLNNSIPVGNIELGHSITGAVISDLSNFKTIELLIPVSHIMQGVNSSTVTTLPNGDPLDFIATGEAQHLSFTVGAAASAAHVHFYFSPPYHLGVFIQTSFDLASSNKFPVAEGNSVELKGFFSTHPHRPPLNGGAFLFISLPR